MRHEHDIILTALLMIKVRLCRTVMILIPENFNLDHLPTLEYVEYAAFFVKVVILFEDCAYLFTSWGRRYVRA